MQNLKVGPTSNTLPFGEENSILDKIVLLPSAGILDSQAYPSCRPTRMSGTLHCPTLLGFPLSSGDMAMVGDLARCLGKTI